MLSAYIQGMALGAAMIIPLGPQNMLVMNQGIRRQHHLTVASLCSLSDIILICVGVFGGSLLLSQSPLLLMLLTWGGTLFLLWYGWGALKSVWRQQWQPVQQESARGRRAVILTLMAVTWLNPHVYLDTVVILGSIGGQLPSYQRLGFAGGAITASLWWFFSLALMGAWLSPWLNRAMAQRIINLLVVVVMWSVAFQLAKRGIAMLTINGGIAT
ncbi:MAG: arginine exporter ArgO [Enterobacteriaceae bacterium]